MTRLNLTAAYRWVFAWPFDLVVNIAMLSLGLFIILWPNNGIAGYMQATFRFPMVVYGGITIICALQLLYKSNTLRFVIFTTPLMAYALMSIPYFVDGLLNHREAGTTVIIAWPLIYWLISWVNNRRIDLLTIHKGSALGQT